MQFDKFAVESAVDATAEFKFPVSVMEEFKSNATEEMVFIGAVGGGFKRETSDLPVTLRQVALTRKCVSRRWSRRPHL